MNLSAIAQDGHVMQLIFDPKLSRENGGRLVPQRIGVHQASTFLGFCSSHDASTFTLIDQPIQALTDEHIFLLAYRAICRELYTKNASMQAAMQTGDLDKGKNLSAQRAIQRFNFERMLGLVGGIRDLQSQKLKYDYMLIEKRFEAISYYILELDHAVEMVCAVGFTPEVDFSGSRLQALDGSMEQLAILTCSITKTTTGSAIVFAWIEDVLMACSRFVNSLDSLKPYRIPSALVSLIFEHGENVFFSESWWNRLDPAERAAIEKRANSFHNKAPNVLADDGSRPVLWSVVGKRKVVRS